MKMMMGEVDDGVVTLYLTVTACFFIENPS